jgi:chromosome segregation ATPase
MSDDVTKNLDPLQQILARLDGLEQKVDARLMDTRPIWERALAEITATRAELAETRAELAELRTSVERRLDKLEVDLAEFRRETNANLHSVDRQIMVVGKELIHLRSDQHYLEDRVEAIEQMLKPNA